MALEQILGHRWIGVLLGVVAMCTAIVWALQDWFPRNAHYSAGFWLCFGFFIFSYRINSYRAERRLRSVSMGDWSLAELKALASGLLHTVPR